MLETLRSKPKHIKQIISIALTVVIFSVILFVWVSSKEARSREAEVLHSTVSPLGGVASMFDGLFSDFKSKMNGNLLYKENNMKSTTTNEKDFELSGVMIIDTFATTSSQTTTTTRP